MEDGKTLYLRIPPTSNGKCKVRLPKEFEHHHDDNWHVALLGFYCSYTSKASSVCNQIILQLDELCHTNATDKNLHLTNILDVIPTNHFAYEPKTVTYLRLNSAFINEFNFTLTSEKGIPVQLVRNECFIKMQVHNKNSKDNSFMLHLKSTEADNGTVNFKLNHDIKLEKEGTWKIAVKSIHYPQFMVPKKYTLEMEFKYRDMPKQKIRIKPQDVKDEKDLMKRLVRGFSKLKVPTNNLKFIISDYNNGKPIFVWKDEEPLSIWFNKDLAYMLGNSQYGYNNAAVYFTISKANPQKSFDNPVDISRTRPAFGKVMCDIMRPITINSIREQLLTYIPLEEVGTTMLKYEPHHMHFIEVNDTVLRNINLKLLDPNNNPLIFSTSSTKSTIMLNLYVKQFD